MWIFFFCLGGSSRTITHRADLVVILVGSGRQWHIFNLLSNHVLFKQSPVLSHFGLKFICCLFVWTFVLVEKLKRGWRPLPVPVLNPCSGGAWLLSGQLCFRAADMDRIRVDWEVLWQPVDVILSFTDKRAVYYPVLLCYAWSAGPRWGRAALTVGL